MEQFPTASHPARTVRRCLSLVCLLVLPAASIKAQEPGLTDAERSELVELMLASEADLVAALAGVSEEAWNWKPAPDRWSVGQCAEHIVRTERSLLATAKRALAGEAAADWREKTAGKAELIRRVMPDRSGPGAQAPQEVRPRDGLAREQVLAEFHRARSELAELLQQADLPVHSHLQEHPFPVFGWLSAYEWLIYVPLHTIRHTGQIREVRATDGFPGPPVE